jgi:hypothetical protein
MRLGIAEHEEVKLVKALEQSGIAVLWVMSGPKGLLG